MWLGYLVVTIAQVQQCIRQMRWLKLRLDKLESIRAQLIVIRLHLASKQLSTFLTNHTPCHKLLIYYLFFLFRKLITTAIQPQRNWAHWFCWILNPVFLLWTSKKVLIHHFFKHNLWILVRLKTIIKFRMLFDCAS